MQTGSSETLISWKSGKTTFVPHLALDSGDNRSAEYIEYFVLIV